MVGPIVNLLCGIIVLVADYLVSNGWQCDLMFQRDSSYLFEIKWSYRLRTASAAVIITEEKKHQGINSNQTLKLTVDLRGTHGPRLLLILPHHVEAPGGVIGGRLLDTGVPARNIVFGFVRSSRSHNVCPSVTLVICCSEHSIFICLAQISKLFAHHSPSLSQLSPKSLSVSLSTLLALS